MAPSRQTDPTPAKNPFPEEFIMSATPEEAEGYGPPDTGNRGSMGKASM